MEIKICPPSVDPRENFHNDQRVNEITDILLENGKIFLREMAHVLVNSKDSTGLENSLRSILRLFRLQNPDLIEKLCTIWDNLDQIYKDPNITHLKGAIVEVYVYKLMKKRHSTNIHYECKIKIDEWKSSKEVDVGFLKGNSNSCECYECKLGVGALSSDSIPKQLENLKDIYFYSRGQAKTKIVSFEDEDTVKTKIQCRTGYFPELETYGRQQLTNN